MSTVIFRFFFYFSA
ncbi:pheST operon leader peptide PheM [Budvicia diplopodorum]